MASDWTIRAINDWRATMQVQLSTALRVAEDVWRKGTEETTKRLLILMAESAKAITPQARKNRKIHRDDHNRPYVEWYLGDGTVQRIYKWQCDKPESRMTWERAKNISRRGLAKRSWLWGLKYAMRKPIEGTYDVQKLALGRRVVGWQKINKLRYIDKIMPAGYEATAARAASNKLMHLAEAKLVADFEKSLRGV